MTNQTQDPSDPDEGESVGTPPTDPMIAERFSQLDSVAAPPAEAILDQADGETLVPVGAAASTVGATSAVASPSPLGGVTPYRVVAAAAAAVVLAVGAVALSSRGGDTVGTDEVAGEAVVEADADDAAQQDDDDGLTSQVVDDDPEEPADVMTEETSDEDASLEDDSPDGEDDDAGVLVIEDDDESGDDGSDTGDESAVPTTLADPDDESEGGADAEPEDEMPEEPADELPPPTTEPVDSGGSADTTRISGLVTEVMVDCQSHQVLGDNGKVEDTGAVTCDGGSFIVVNGTRIFTSAGFTAAEFYWDKHNPKLRPGLNVSVVAAPIAGGPLGLACDECGVRIG